MFLLFTDDVKSMNDVIECYADPGNILKCCVHDSDERRSENFVHTLYLSCRHVTADCIASHMHSRVIQQTAW